MEGGTDFEIALIGIDLGAGIDGAETARRLLQNRDLPIVFLSAHAEQSFVEKIEEISNYGYVIKNSGEFILRQTLKTALMLHRQKKQTDPLLANLQNSNHRLDLIMESRKIGWWEVSLASGLTVFSRNLEGMLGHETGNIHNYTDFVKLVHEHDRERIEEAMRNHASGESPAFDVEFQIDDSQGNCRWLRAVGMMRPPVSAGGDLVVAGIVIDISDEKAAEAAKIEKERLGVVQEIVSAVAHDFNNALQIITANIELALLQPELPQRVKRYLDSIKTIALATSKNIKPLQNTISAHFGQEQFSPVALDEVVRESIQATQPLWMELSETKNQADVIFIKLESKRSIRGHRAALSSVLLNLIKNAVEAMPSGGQLHFETVDLPSGVRFRLRDTGIGMDDSTRLRIFQPFFSTKGFDRGRGLGMSSVASTVKEHHGSIQVLETAIDGGTTIEMILPFAAQTRSLPSPDTPAPFVRLRILWVDDDDEVRNSGLEMLRSLGQEAEAAQDGFEALEMARTNHYDLIITDLGMKGLNGWQVAQGLHDNHVSAKVVLVTGWGEQVSESETSKHFLFESLAKPVGVDQLKGLIQRVASSESRRE